MNRNNNRAKPKSVEELDAEMVDYFATNENTGSAENTAQVNGDAQQQQQQQQQPTNGGEDLGMAEISVSIM